MDRGRSEAPTNTEAQPAISPPPHRSTIWPVFVAYVVAVALVFLATTAVIVAVAGTLAALLASPDHGRVGKVLRDCEVRN